MKLEEKIDKNSIIGLSLLLFVIWLFFDPLFQFLLTIKFFFSEYLSFKIEYILLILYAIGCFASFQLVKDEKEKGSLILLLGAYTAFIFSASLIPKYDDIYSNQNIIDIIKVIIELEVLLLAIGVPIVFNSAIRDEDPEKHYYSIKTLKFFIIISTTVTLSLLFILLISNDFSLYIKYIFSFTSYNLNNYSIGYIISISIFMFIFSIFLFIYTIFDLVNIFLKYNHPIMAKFKTALIENDLHAIDRYSSKLDNQSKKDVLAKVMQTENPNFEGIYYLVKKDLNIQKNKSVQLFLKSHIEDAIQNNNEDKIDKCYEILDVSCIISVVSEFIYNINNISETKNYEKIAKSLHIILNKDPNIFSDLDAIKMLYKILERKQNKNLGVFVTFLAETFKFDNKMPGV